MASGEPADLTVTTAYITAEEEWRILALPRGQRRTAGFKKAVFVDKKFVYKGPYQSTDKQLLLNIQRPRQLLLLQREFCGIADTMLPWTRLLCVRGAAADAASDAGTADADAGEGGSKASTTQRFYFEMTNVGKAPSAGDWVVESTGVESDVLIIHRGAHVHRFSEVEDSASEADRVRVLQHLFICFLLNIGDHGSHNVLFAPHLPLRVVGIDLEETRTCNISLSGARSPAAALAVLFKRPSKKQRELYGPLLSRLAPCVRRRFAVKQLVARLGVSQAQAELIEARRSQFAAAIGTCWQPWQGYVHVAACLRLCVRVCYAAVM